MTTLEEANRILKTTVLATALVLFLFKISDEVSPVGTTGPPPGANDDATIADIETPPRAPVPADPPGIWERVWGGPTPVPVTSVEPPVLKGPPVAAEPVLPFIDPEIVNQEATRTQVERVQNEYLADLGQVPRRLFRRSEVGVARAFQTVARVVRDMVSAPCEESVSYLQAGVASAGLDGRRVPITKGLVAFDIEPALPAVCSLLGQQP